MAYTTLAQHCVVTKMALILRRINYMKQIYYYDPLCTGTGGRKVLSNNAICKSVCPVFRSKRAMGTIGHKQETHTSRRRHVTTKSG